MTTQGRMPSASVVSCRACPRPSRFSATNPCSSPALPPASARNSPGNSARPVRKLTLAARRRDRLETLAQKIAALAGTPAAGRFRMRRDARWRPRARRRGRRAPWGKLDVAIANAGFGVVAPIKKLTLDDYRRQFETNVFGVLRTDLRRAARAREERAEISPSSAASRDGSRLPAPRPTR